MALLEEESQKQFYLEAELMEGIHLLIDSDHVKRNLKGDRGMEKAREILAVVPSLIETKPIGDIVMYDMGNGVVGFILLEDGGHVKIRTSPEEGEYHAEILMYDNNRFELAKTLVQFIYGGRTTFRTKLRGDNHFREG